jgi:hypothetical protein
MIVIRNHGSDLSLLKHEFGDEDGVGIVGAAPWEIATIMAIPAQKRALEVADFFRCSNGSQQTLNVQRSTSNVQFRVER